MALLSRDQIAEAKDVVFEDVEVPEWGGSVRVRGLTARQRGEYEQSLVKGTGRNRSIEMRGGRERLLVLCCVDETGMALFTADDVRMLARKSAAAVERVYDVAARISGLTEAEAGADLEDFDTAQSGDSSTD